jgi:hypothetical protein
MGLVMVLGLSSAYMKVRSSLLALKVLYNSEELVITQMLKLDIIFLILRHYILLCCNIFKKVNQI